MSAHAESDRLLDYAYGELAPGDAAQFEGHLQGCTECAEELAAIRGVRRTMARLEPEPVPAQGLESLRAYAEQAARRAQSGPVKSTRGRGWILGLSAGAAAIVVAGIAHLVLDEGQPASERVAEYQARQPEAQTAVEGSKGEPMPALGQAPESEAVPAPVQAPVSPPVEKKELARKSSPKAAKRAPTRYAEPPPPASPQPMEFESPSAAKVAEVEERRAELRSAPARESVGGRAGAPAAAAQPSAAMDAAANVSVDGELQALRAQLARQPRGAELERVLISLCRLEVAYRRVADARFHCQRLIRELPDSQGAAEARELVKQLP